MWSERFDTLRGEIVHLLSQGQDVQLKDTLRGTLKTAEQLRTELGFTKEESHAAHA